MWTVIKAWPAALLAAVLLGGTYGAGYVRAKHTCTAETTQMQLTHTAQRLAAEQEYGVKLAAAAAEKQHWYDLSQRQSKELAEAQAELEKSRNTLQEQNRAAVEKGGSSFNGIGPNSLHLYKRAFGYTD